MILPGGITEIIIFLDISIERRNLSLSCLVSKKNYENKLFFLRRK